jgi:uncharacterized membrane protein
MKVKLILSVMAVSFLALTSCKKDWNCTCKAGGFSLDAETYKDETKNNAESKCADFETEAQNSFGSGVNCSINEAE